MDWRILVVFSPLIIAAGWALFTIGVAAISQFQAFLNKK